MDFPTTPLATAADALISECQQPFLRNHCLRSYLFARAAGPPAADYDHELVFLICALHDLGLTDRADTDQRFEVAGADLAATFLEQHGVTDHRVDIVWDAIAQHTSAHFHDSPVYQRRRPMEIRIARTGIGIDLGGDGALPPGYADQVHAAYPRLGGARALADAMVAQAYANPAKAPPMTLPGELLHQRHPELPYLTWDLMVEAGRWGD